MQPILVLEGLRKEFVARGRRVVAVEEVDLAVYPGEFLTIVGPSGCGKSTLLNMVAGLIRPTQGRVVYKGVEKRGIDLSIGYITQRDNLLPWRTLLGNVELPLELMGVPARERRERALFWIERVGLAGFEHHYPHELSGGMRQRANIARTLVRSPEVILMDEPFGPLDALTRLVLQAELLKLWEAERKTVIFITHDLAEAIVLADRTAVMTARPGRIKRVLEIHLPRPRSMHRIHDDPAFRELYRLLWSDLVGEAVEPVREPALAAKPQGRAAPGAPPAPPD